MTIDELIQTYFDSFNRHDAEGLLATLSEDVVHDINEGGSEVGKDAFRAFKAHMDRCYSEQIEDLVIFTSGDRGAAEFTVVGTYVHTDGDLPEANGQRYRIPCAAFFAAEKGYLTRVTSYYNVAEWIRQIQG